MCTHQGTAGQLCCLLWSAEGLVMKRSGPKVPAGLVHMQLSGAHRSMVEGSPCVQHSSQEDLPNVHELSSLHPLEGGGGCPVKGVSVECFGGHQPLLPRSSCLANLPDFLSQGPPAEQPKHCWAEMQLARCPLRVAGGNMLEVCFWLQGPLSQSVHSLAAAMLLARQCAQTVDAAVARGGLGWQS